MSYLACDRMSQVGVEAISNGKLMARTPQDVTDTELEILRLLWSQAPQSIRDLTRTLRPQQADSYYSTVKKLLERLEAKGCVKRESASIAHLYSPLLERQELVDRRLADLTDDLCAGSPTPLLTHLAQHQALSSEQQQQLLKLIEQLDSPIAGKPASRRKKR